MSELASIKSSGLLFDEFYLVHQFSLRESSYKINTVGHLLYHCFYAKNPLSQNTKAKPQLSWSLLPNIQQYQDCHNKYLPEWDHVSTRLHTQPTCC